MKYKNKITGEIKEAKSITEKFALSHNSNWELVEELKVNKKEEKSKSEKNKNEVVKNENNG